MGFIQRSVLQGLSLSFIAQSALAGPYSISQTNIGDSFLDNFQWENITDPTAGRVEYVTQATALSENLTYTTDDSFVMRADSSTILSADGPGRKSNRIKSKAQYNTHVAVFDITHMPQGCGTWPAVWEADDSIGSAAGEVDIFEGVNDLSPNSVTLHTEGTCTMPTNRTQLGTSLSNDCSSTSDLGNGNNGCSVDAPYTSSYGPVFNQNGGGYYAVERTSGYIRVWFWPRTDAGVPSDVSSGASTIETDNWGTPIAYFPSTNCSINDVFSNNNIIIDLTFCGHWANSDFNAAGCPGNCTAYVNDNPTAFEGAYWDFAAVRIYESTSSSSTNVSTNVVLAKTSSSSVTVGRFGYFMQVVSSPAAIALAILGGAWGLA